MSSRPQRRQVSRHRNDPIDWKEARRLYVKEGLTYAEIARRLGRSKGGVSHTLRAHGVPRRPLLASTTGPWSKRLWGVWSLMKKKCRDRTYKSYKYFGARGIDLCPQWERFDTFYQWAIASGYEPGCPLVLRDGAKQFSPRGCCWARPEERVKLRLQLNPVPPRRVITAFGETKGVLEWVKDPRCTVGRRTLALRIDRGYAPEDAISLPRDAARSAASRRLIRRRRGRPPARPKANAIDWGKAVKLYLIRGMSAPRIARAVGASHAAVLVGLKRLGLYRPRDKKDARLAAPLHRIWFKVRQIGARPRNAGPAYEGAPGARVSPEWRTFTAFYLWALESGYRRGMRLTRRNKKAGFSPANCAWLPARKGSPPVDDPPWKKPPRWTIRAFGETKGLNEWSKDSRCRVSGTSLAKRLRRGMDPEDALTKPRKPIRLVTAFGETRHLAEWSRDPRCRVGVEGLRLRLDSGLRPELAITTPFPGVYGGKLREGRSRRRTRKRRRQGGKG